MSGLEHKIHDFILFLLPEMKNKTVGQYIDLKAPALVSLYRLCFHIVGVCEGANQQLYNLR